MAFRYTLRTLLRLRESLERQEEQRLLAVAALVTHLRAELEQFCRDELLMQQHAQHEMISGSCGALVRFGDVCRLAAMEVRRRLEQRLGEAERKRMEQLREYQAAKQNREILEGIRLRQEAAYELQSARREQQAADEAFLIRSRRPAEELVP